MTCRLETDWSYRGLRCLRLENEHLAVDVMPELGGKISRFLDKRADRDLLWHSPRVQPHQAPLHADFDDNWSGGWDEIFPTGERSHTLAGEPLPHMGELWGASCDWQVLEAGPGRIEIVLDAMTPITPARWRRRMVLQAAEPILRLDYQIDNVGLEPFDFNFGLHPAGAISPLHRFDVPAASGQVADAGGQRLGVPGQEYHWPRLGPVDLRCALDPEQRCFALHYLTELEAGWVASTDTALRRGWGLVFDQNVFPVVWLWLVYGGWRGYYHAILEPWSGYPSSLDSARNQGRVRALAAGQSLQTTVAAVIYSGVSAVSSLKGDGSVME